MFSLLASHNRPRICYLSVIDTFAPTVPREDKNPVSLAKAPESQKEQIKNSISADLHSLESEATSKKISAILKGKFDSLGLSFDVTKFEKTMQDALGSVMRNPDIPFIAKRKFLEDVNSKVTLLSSVTSVDIENLKTQRNVMSLGVEAMELSGKTEKEKQALYLNKILAETIGKYITPTALGLIEAFSGAQTRIGEVSYQKKSLDAYSTGIVSLDTKYGLSMKGVLDRLHKNSAEKKSDLMTDGISREMRNTIIVELAERYPTFAAKPNIQTVLATLKVNPSFQIRYTPDMTVEISGQKIALRDIIDDYRKVNATWQGSEHEIRDARDTALADGVIAKTRNGLGIDQLRSEFDHLSPENIEAKMKNASLADMMIIMTQLAQAIPIVGDIGGGTFDLITAITSISTDGAKMSTVERSLSGVFGVLGITVFGGWINRARKAGKLAGLAKVLPLMQKYMPEKIETFVKGGGKIGKEMGDKIMNLAKIIGGEVGKQIEKYMFRQGFALGFTEDAKHFDELRRNNPQPGDIINIRRSNGDITPVKLIRYELERDVLVFAENGEEWEKPLSDLVLESESIKATRNVTSKKPQGDILERKISLLHDKWKTLPMATRVLINQLYPDNLYKQSQQGEVGNCYFLAALHSAKYAENIHELLAKMIKKVPEGWEVTFLGLKSPNNKTIITPKELDILEVYNKESGYNERLSSDGALGDRILERAYWRLRDYRAQVKGGKKDSTNDIKKIPGIGSGHTIANFVESPIYRKSEKNDKYEVVGSKFDRSHEGGFSRIALEDMFGYNTSKLDLHGKYKTDVRTILSHLDNPDQTMITLSSKPANGGDRSSFILMTTTGEHTMSYQHAYSMFYDPIHDTVTIMNPHDTLNKRSVITLDELLKNKNFDHIDLGIPPSFKATIGKNINNIKSNPSMIPLGLVGVSSALGAIGIAGKLISDAMDENK